MGLSGKKSGAESSMDGELFQHLQAFRQAQGFSAKAATKYAHYMTDLERGRTIVKKLCEHSMRDQRILDVGCGFGTLLKAFSETGAHVHGIDIDLDRVKWASRRLNGGDIRCESATELPWEQSTFDIVTSTDVLEHLPLEAQSVVVREMIRVTKPGGIIYLEVPNKFQLLDEHNHIPFGTWLPTLVRAGISRLLTGHFVQCWERSKTGWHSLMAFNRVTVLISEKFPYSQRWVRLFALPPNRFHFLLRKVM